MKVTRRSYLATALAGTVGVAGCLGGTQFELEGEDILPVPVAGDPDADVTVMVFEDFACPSCRQYKRNIYPQIAAQYIGQDIIRYEHRDFPIPVDDTWSWAIAGATRSVQEHAGDEMFWAFATSMYQNFDNYSFEMIENVASELELDGEHVRQDAEDDVYREDLEAERERADDAGVSGTPIVVVDGTPVDTTLEDIETAIENAR